ncbi:hypothetical protein HK102_001508, partial [Quaeritorhiza haematococci]
MRDLKGRSTSHQQLNKSQTLSDAGKLSVTDLGSLNVSSAVSPSKRNLASTSFLNLQSMTKSTAPDSSGGVQAPPDVVYKMCKKIAQLTKVIYYLNTKSEDHMAEKKNLVESYETEIAEIIKSGNDNIATLSQQLEEKELQVKAQEEVIKSYLESIARKEKELSEAKETGENLRNSVTDLQREKEMLESVTTQEKDNVTADLSKMQDELAAEKSHHDQELQDLKATHQRDLEQVEARSKAEHEEAEKKLHEVESEFAKKLSETEAQWRDKLEAAHAEHEVALQTERENMEARIKETEEAWQKKYDDEVTELQSQVRRLTQSAQDKAKELQQFERKMMIEIDEERQKVTTRDITITQLKEEVTKKGDKITALEKMLEDERDASQHLQVERDRLMIRVASLQRDVESVESAMQERDGRIRDLQFEVEKRNGLLKDTQTRLTEVTGERDHLKSELDSVTMNLNIAQSSLSELSNEAQHLRTVNTALEANLAQQESTIHVLNEKMSEIIIQKAEELHETTARLKKELQTAHEKELTDKIRELKAQHSKAIERKDQKISILEAKVDDLQKETQQQLDALRASHVAEMQQFQVGQSQRFVKLDEFRGLTFSISIQETIASLTKVKSESAKKLQDMKMTLEEKASENAKLQATIHQMTGTIKRLEVDKADMFQKMLTIDKTIREEMNKRFRREMVEMEDQLKIKASVELEQMKNHLLQEHAQELQTTLMRAEEEKQAALEHIMTEHNTLKTEFEHERTELNWRIEKTEQEKQNYMMQMVDLKEDHAKELAETYERQKEEFEMEKKELERKWAECEAQLKQMADETIAQLEVKYATLAYETQQKHDKEIGSLHEAHEKALSDLKLELEAQRQLEIQTLHDHHKALVDRLNDEHIKNLDETKEEMNQIRLNEIKAISDAHAAEIAEKDEEISKLSLDNSDHLAKEEEMSLKISAQEEEITQLTQHVTEKDEDLKNEREYFQAQITEVEKKLRAEMKFEITKVNEAHLDESRKMLSEFEQAQNFLKKQIAHLQKQVQDAEQKYINREPREIDLKRISELEDDIRRRKRKIQQLSPTPVIKSLQEEIEHFKLELNNREANFNKIFNKTPLVGVLQPQSLSQK